MASVRRSLTLVGAGFLGILDLLSVAAFVLPSLMVSSTDVPNTVDRLAAQNAIRGTLIQALAGLALLGGAAMTAIFSARTIRLNREGQITDRFTKAIDQLGNDRLEIRLGGIYALERIAQESQRDRWPIMEVLTAFLRAHPSEIDPDLAASGSLAPDDYPVRGADVQAVVTVIGRREWIDSEHDRLDFKWADLRLLHMHSGHLEGALFIGAHLEGAVLIGANLKDAILIGAHLKGTDLSEAHLEGAILIGAHSEGSAPF